MSAESGLKTFREMGGLWETYEVTEVATPEAWANNPELVMHFYNERHGRIYQAMLELFENHEPVDVVTLTAKLKKSGNLKASGGSSYLSDLLNIVPTSAHAVQYARIIHHHFVKRSLVKIAARITEQAFKDEGEAKGVLGS
jgi:replicative DNA helicase